MCVVFATERYNACVSEIVELSNEHHDEVGPHGGQFTVNPDVDAYRRLDEMGFLVIVTARERDVLVGYALAVLMPSHLHFKGLRWASSDGVWLQPSHRRPRVADRMLAFFEDSLRERGVILSIISAHPDHPALARLLIRRGYGVSSIGHSRRL